MDEKQTQLSELFKQANALNIQIYQKNELLKKIRSAIDCLNDQGVVFPENYRAEESAENEYLSVAITDQIAEQVFIEYESTT